MTTLTWDQVAAWRAGRHQLDGRVPAKAMLEVAGRIAGVHAQVMSSAELTLWARVEGLVPDAVRRALWSERGLVKTWPCGTLHLLPAAELPLWQAALSTRRPWEAGAWQRGFGVTLAELEQLNDAVAEALDGRLLTREELADAVAERTGSSWAASCARAGGPCSSRPPPLAGSASLPARASRSASPGPTPGWAAGPTTTPTRPWTRSPAASWPPRG